MPEPELSLIEQEAIRWWTARHAGQWSIRQDQELEAWLSCGEAHRQAYTRLARVWEIAGHLPATPAPKRAPRNGARRALGLTLALTCLLPLGWQTDRWWNGIPTTWSTSRGEQKSLSLADGSEIVLAANSEISVQIGYGRRQAKLLRGEVLFSIQHNPNRPFAVSAGIAQITDLGTVFHVELKQQGADVGVMEGQVGIVTPEGEMALSAGESGGYQNDGQLNGPFLVRETVDNWKAGRRVFRDEPLGQILERFQSRQAVKFELADPALARLPINGVFGLDNPELFVKTLGTGFTIRIQTIPGGWRLSQR